MNSSTTWYARVVPLTLTIKEDTYNLLVSYLALSLNASVLSLYRHRHARDCSHYLSLLLALLRMNLTIITRPDLMVHIITRMEQTSMYILFCTFVAAITLFYLLRARKTIDETVTSVQEKSPSATTPPRSLSPPNEKSSSEAPATSTLPVTISNPSLRGGKLQIFPPSRRGSLAFGLGTPTTPDDVASPIGSTPEQIAALGDFPDYEKLSGVPLPQPYLNFDIKMARPRPYRPFRWNYYQTMCTFKFPFIHSAFVIR